MGFFSQNCHRCGHPALSIFAADRINAWMVDVVVVTPNGSILKGDYDGYGRVDGRDAIGLDGNTVWHEACWEVAGSPTDYRGPSPHSDDQGWFFDDGAHSIPDPRKATPA